MVQALLGSTGLTIRQHMMPSAVVYMQRCCRRADAGCLADQQLHAQLMPVHQAATHLLLILKTSTPAERHSSVSVHGGGTHVASGPVLIQDPLTTRGPAKVVTHLSNACSLYCCMPLASYAPCDT